MVRSEASEVEVRPSPTWTVIPAAGQYPRSVLSAWKLVLLGVLVAVTLTAAVGVLFVSGWWWVLWALAAVVAGAGGGWLGWRVNVPLEVSTVRHMSLWGVRWAAMGSVGGREMMVLAAGAYCAVVVRVPPDVVVRVSPQGAVSVGGANAEWLVSKQTWGGLRRALGSRPPLAIAVDGWDGDMIVSPSGVVVCETSQVSQVVCSGVLAGPPAPLLCPPGVVALFNATA